MSQFYVIILSLTWTVETVILLASFMLSFLVSLGQSKRLYYEPV